MNKFFKKVDRVIFFSSLLVTILFIIWYWTMPETFTNVTGAIFTAMNGAFGWSYMLGYLFFIVAMCYLAFSKYGRIRLCANQSDEPEYSMFTWVAMMFAAGLGVGITYYGIYVTLDHYYRPPFGLEPQSAEAWSIGINYATWYHALHPWSGYLIVGLIIAYFSYNRNAGGLFSTPLIQAFAKPNPDGTPRRETSWGKVIDAYIIFLTLGGVCASYSLACNMIGSGIEYIFGIPSTFLLRLIILAVLTAILILSTNSGLSKGMALMSDWNLRLCIIILAMFLVFGNTINLIESWIQCLGDLIINWVPMTFFMDATGSTQEALNGFDFVRDWPVMILAFFMAWTPFVGIFIAKISRGRSIRELVIGGMLLPTLFAHTWNAIVGTQAVLVDRALDGGLMKQIGGVWGSCTFALYQHMPLTVVFGVLTLILIITFILTSCDSADFTISVLSCRGDMNPPTWLRVAWAVIMSGMASIFLAGGAGAIQNIQGICTLPMFVLIPLMFVAFVKILKTDFEDKHSKQLHLERIKELRAIRDRITAEDEAAMGVKLHKDS